MFLFPIGQFMYENENLATKFWVYLKNYQVMSRKLEIKGLVRHMNQRSHAAQLSILDSPFILQSNVLITSLKTEMFTILPSFA